MSINNRYHPKKSKYFSELMNIKKYKVPLKRSMSGYELEYTLIDKNGDVSFNSDDIIKELRKEDKKFPIQYEVGLNMVEIISYPHAKVQKTALNLIDNTIKVIDAAEKHGSQLFPFGTYPGVFKPVIRKGERYAYSSVTIDKKSYEHFYPRCFGYHYHYAAPRGIFDAKKGILNKQFKSTIKNTLIDSYNLLIAADPFVTVFTQSSPFESNKHIAKDTRMLYWRGGKKLKYPGVFNKFQLLGGLQPYKQTLADLMSSLDRKDVKVRKLMKQARIPKKFIDNKHPYDFMWNPVKINKLGTIEQRGMDTNYLQICLGVSVMLKFILRAVQQEFFHIIPSDIGTEEPFKLEGNVIFVPPHTEIQKKFQYNSAYFGLADEDVYNGARRFFKLAKTLTYSEYVPAIKTINKMIDDKETMSDRIISYAKRKGLSENNEITQETARKIALRYSKKMREDAEKTKKLYEGLDEL